MFSTLIFLIVSPIVISVLFRINQDPLRQLPGPLLARFTSLWLQVVDGSGYRSATLHSLHKKHGSIIRIGPNELSFTSRQALSDIYGPSSKYDKAGFYDSVGRGGLFTMRMHQDHQDRLMALAPAFKSLTTTEIESFIAEPIQRLLEHLREQKNRPMDMLLWFRSLAIDVISTILLGSSVGALDGNQHQTLRDLDGAFPAFAFDYNFHFLRQILSLLPISSLQQFLNAGDQFYEKGEKRVDEYISLYGRKGGRPDLLMKLLAGTGHGKEFAPLPDREISTEISNFTFAGADTTATTFTYLFWELARNPGWQDHLREELEAATSKETIKSYGSISELPILDAIIRETMRLYPAVPASLQRAVPRGGRVIDGMMIPENTIVSCQAYSVHRDETIFPDPDTFKPQRWLNTTGTAALNAMRSSMLVWGRSQRICIGRTIAKVELKVATSAIIQRFRVELADNHVEDDMTMTDHFVINPKGGRCMLKFTSTQ